MHPQAAVDGLKPQHAAVACSHPPQRLPDQLLQQRKQRSVHASLHSAVCMESRMATRCCELVPDQAAC